MHLVVYYSGITNSKFHNTQSKEFTSRDICTNCLHETNNTFNNIYLHHDVPSARVFVHVNQPCVCTVQITQTRRSLAFSADISIVICGSKRRFFSILCGYQRLNVWIRQAVMGHRDNSRGWEEFVTENTQ